MQLLAQDTDLRTQQPQTNGMALKDRPRFTLKDVYTYVQLTLDRRSFLSRLVQQLPSVKAVFIVPTSLLGGILWKKVELESRSPIYIQQYSVFASKWVCHIQVGSSLPIIGSIMPLGLRMPLSPGSRGFKSWMMI
jgi:hypothetical protein